MKSRDKPVASETDTPLNCPACGCNVAHLLPDEESVARCPECPRRVITRKELRGLRRRRKANRLRARRALILGLVQGVLTGLWIYVFIQLTMGATDTGIYRVMNTELLFLVPVVSLTVAGVCGGMWGGFKNDQTTGLDFVGGSITLLLGWFVLVFFTLFGLSQLTMLARSVAA